MARPEAPKPDRHTGLPPGVEVGPLGKRFVAHLIDGLVPAVIALVTVVPVTGAREPSTAVTVVGLTLVLVWGLVVWWMFATRAAGPGMRLMKLQLVGFADGRPIGWGRYLVRAIVLAALSATGIGLVLMVIFLLRHPRQQGWHDLSADSVVIKERMLAPRVRNTTSSVGASHERARAVTSVNSSPAAPAASRPALAAGSDLMPAGSSAPQPGPPAAGPAVGSSNKAQPAPAAATDWVAVLDDGRELAISGLVLLGRNPQARPGEEAAQLVKLSDESRTVSKSHLALDTDDRGLVVVDRGSTNGSTVTTPDGQVTRCSAWEPVNVAEGSVVSMGDHWLTVRRG